MLWFDDWQSLMKVLAAGVTSYVFLILFLRISGKRTLSQLNMFDFVITVAFGSTIATTILSRDTPIVNGLTALALLVLMQYVVAWTSMRWGWLRKLVKSTPRLLYFRGEYHREAMRRERIEEGEIIQAIRSMGIGSMDQVEAVVLETNGNLSVLKSVGEGKGSTLGNVEGV